MSSTAEMEKLTAWLNDALDGTVTRCERQQRWRPGWFVDFRYRDGREATFFVRGDRHEEFPPWPLEYEHRIIETLQDTPIPVPKVLGFCPDPRAIVLEHMPGRPNLGTAETEAERAAVMDELAGHIATMHSLDIAPFVAAGLTLPTTDEQRIIPYFLEGEKIYLRYKTAPDPRMEFIRAWIHRNLPANRAETRFLHGDPGQFLFQDGNITTMLDFEWSCLGDPIMDLGGLRLRALHEPMGDIRPLFRRYAELSGRKLDREVVGFHTVAFSANNGLAISHAVHDPKPGVDYPEYVSWYILGVLFTVKAIAEVCGATLTKPAAPAPGPGSRWGGAYDVIAGTFGSEAGTDADDSTTIHRRHLADGLAAFGRNLDRLDHALDAEYIASVSRLVGEPITDWREADRLLEAFVWSAGAEHDEALLDIFHRWSWKQIGALDGVVHNKMWDLELQPLSEILADG